MDSSTYTQSRLASPDSLLLQLPAEILGAICEVCAQLRIPGSFRPHALLQLVRTCSALRDVAQPWLYRRPQLGWSENDMIRFLEVLVDRPDLGQHVRELSLHTKVIRQRQPQLSLLVRIGDRYNLERPDEPPVRLSRHSHSALPSTYEEDIIWQLIVRLAPKLTCLTFSSRCEMPMFIHHEPKLHNLESLTIKSDFTDMTPWSPGDPPRTLESCPRLKYLTLGETHAGTFTSIRSDSITHVDLSRESGDLTTLRDVCIGMPNLQSIRVFTPRTADPLRWEAAYTAISQRQDTLRELCIVILARDLSSVKNVRFHDFLSLKSFTLLEDLALFIPVASPWDIGMSVIDFLPRSIRRLSLSCESEGVLGWVFDLLSIASEHFPRFYRLVLCGDSPLVEQRYGEVVNSGLVGKGIEVVKHEGQIPTLASLSAGR